MPRTRDPQRSTASGLIACVERIHSRGWCPATSGNFSVVVDRDPLRLLMTPSGLDKGTLHEDVLVTVDESGALVAGSGRPSAETELHLTLSRQAGVGSVLHTHSVWNTLAGINHEAEGRLELTGFELLKAVAGYETHEATVVVPVFRNTQDISALARRLDVVLRARPELRAFLIAGHGLYAWGSSPAEALRHVEAFELLFEVVGRRGEPWPS